MLTLKVAGWAGKMSPRNRASIRGAGLCRVVTDLRKPDLPCTGSLAGHLGPGLGVVHVSGFRVRLSSDYGLRKLQAAPSLARRRLYPG
jgi:hypothetical protein